jgi:hypothetical protein
MDGGGNKVPWRLLLVLARLLLVFRWEGECFIRDHNLSGRIAASVEFVVTMYRWIAMPAGSEMEAKCCFI